MCAVRTLEEKIAPVQSVHKHRKRPGREKSLGSLVSRAAWLNCNYSNPRLNDFLSLAVRFTCHHVRNSVASIFFSNRLMYGLSLTRVALLPTSLKLVGNRAETVDHNGREKRRPAWLCNSWPRLPARWIEIAHKTTGARVILPCPLSDELTQTATTASALQARHTGRRKNRPYDWGETSATTSRASVMRRVTSQVVSKTCCENVYSIRWCHEGNGIIRSHPMINDSS